MIPSTPRHGIRLAALTLCGALALAGCGGSGFDSATTSQSNTPSGKLSILIGSSGDAETKAVSEAVAAWSAQSGVQAEVQAASDLEQQLSQGFAASSPPDLFYLSTDSLAGYAKNGSLEAYGSKLSNKDDFYPSLVENFTYDGQFYCAPKDFSTLALVINTKLWKSAGLTDADLPSTWSELADVAAKLTTKKQVGLTFSPEYQRLGVFMAQAGGGLITDGAATADSEANLTALNWVKEQLGTGNVAFSSTLGAGWGGEAFGKEQAAMVIEGNWITGGLKADYPDVEYRVVELPAGPTGKGTMQFTNCWGMSADSTNKDSARSLVEYLTATEQQLAFSAAFGPMPSIASAATTWSADNAELTAFLSGADYAQFPPNQAGAADVISDLNSQLEGLASADPAKILASTQSNLQAILG